MTLAGLTGEWSVIATQSFPDDWRWLLPAADVRAFRMAREMGRVATVRVKVRDCEYQLLGGLVPARYHELFKAVRW